MDVGSKLETHSSQLKSDTCPPWWIKKSYKYAYQVLFFNYCFFYLYQY